MKIRLRVLVLLLVVMTFTACGKEKANNGATKKQTEKTENTTETTTEITTEATTEQPAVTINPGEEVLKYHYADKDEAVSCYLSNEEYFSGMQISDIQYRTQNKNGTIDELKEYGASQMREFSSSEKEIIDELFVEMEVVLKTNGYKLPDVGEITLIKSTQDEEGGSAAYTHGNQIYLGKTVVDYLCSDNEKERLRGKEYMWHELFHCITRNNPDFKKEMYSIIGFTVQDRDFTIPPSALEYYCSNPDVEHHNSYATFKINGEEKDCFAITVVTKQFEKEGDMLLDYMKLALVPVDGSDVYYLSNEVDNLWNVFGLNTSYVIDPEECMADNFSYAMVYGLDGRGYSDPQIIEGIINYLQGK
jgi:hypothetical protein